MFLLLLGLSFVIWVVYFKFKRRRMYQLASAIPGMDEELPFIGLAHTLVGSNEDILNTLQRYSYTSIRKNGIATGWLGHILYFLLVDPVDVEMVLKTCLEKDDLHRFPRKVIGYGGIFAPVAIWRRRRKILTPAFSPKIVDKFVGIFSVQSEKLAENLAESDGRGPVSVWRFLTSFTLDSVGETVMGIKLNSQSNPNAPFLIALQNVLQLVCERIFHLWLHPDWLYNLFPQASKCLKYTKVMHDFTDKVIKNKREKLMNEKILEHKRDSVFDLGKYKTQPFLDLLISISSDEKAYTDIELREELLTITVAGTDTSAVAIGYTLKLLAKYPKVQEKVFQELQEVFGDSNRRLVKEDLLQLKYLEMVVKESLRLFPPVPFIIRKVTEEISIPSGRVLPSGSGIVISIWGIHRDPKYWGPDAECFDPERFLPERYNLKHPCNFMPFSQGPRNCLGTTTRTPNAKWFSRLMCREIKPDELMDGDTLITGVYVTLSQSYQYALMSIKTALATILRTYKIVGEEENGPVPHIKSKLDIMMKAIDDYKIAVERRVFKK